MAGVLLSELTWVVEIDGNPVWFEASLLAFDGRPIKVYRRVEGNLNLFQIRVGPGDASYDARAEWYPKTNDGAGLLDPAGAAAVIWMLTSGGNDGAAA